MNHSTTTVGNLWQCSVILKVRGFHHVGETSSVFISTHSILPCPQVHWKESVSISFTSSFQIFVHLDSTLSLLFSKPES